MCRKDGNLRDLVLVQVLPEDHHRPFSPAGRRRSSSPASHTEGTAVPPHDRRLLARLDMVAHITDRHGLALLPDGRLAAEARMAVRRPA
jgi:hypothetical protein